MKFGTLLTVAMDYLNQFLNPPVHDEEEFERYTNLLQSIVETKLKEEVKLPENTRDIMDWVSKNYLEIEEQVENPQVGMIALAQEEEEDDFEVISSRKEKRLAETLYTFFEYCSEDEEYEEHFENAAQYISDFIKTHISKNLSPKIFHKCINRALRQIKEDLWMDRKESGRVNKFARFLKEMVVFL